MRHLLLFLAFFTATTFLSAQCEIDVNFLTAECDEDAATFTVTFTVDADVEGTWVAPNLNLEGTFNSGDIYTLGPWPATSQGGQFNLFSETVDSCFTTVQLPEINCSDPCFGFFASSFRDEITCGVDGESFLYINFGSSSYPVVVDLLYPGNDTSLYSTDTITEGDFYETIIPNWETLTMRLTNADGCVIQEDIQDPLFSCFGITGRSWWDANANGSRDAGENARVPARVILFREDGMMIDSVRTQFSGTYQFNVYDLDQSYYLEIVPDDPQRQLTANGVGTFCTNNDFNRTTRRTETFVAFPGGSQNCMDAGWVVNNCNNIGFEVFMDFPDLPCQPGVPAVFVDGSAADFPFTLSIIEQSTGEVVETLTVDTSGTTTLNDLPGDSFYSVQLVSATGCSITSEFDNGALSPLPVTIVQEGSICGDAGLTLIAIADFDVPEVTYLWSGGQTSPSIQVEQTGRSYFVQVFTEEGCSGSASIFIPDTGGFTDTIDIEPNYTLGCAGEPVEIGIANPQAGFTYIWFGPQNTTLVGDTIVTAIPGFYEVEGTSGGECFSFGFTQVIDARLGDIELVPIDSDSICGVGTCIQLSGIQLFNSDSPIGVHWDGPPSFDEWFAGQPNLIQGVCGFEEGLYTVTITTACDTVVVSYNSDSPECSEISGTLYLDSDGDCDLDDADTPAPGFVLTLTNDVTGDMYYAWTGDDGNWSVLVPDGTYTIEPVIEPGQPLETCPATTVTLSGAAVTGVNIFMPVLFSCPVLTTEITLPFLRRCFQGCAYVHYENTGTATGEDAQVVVTLDPFFVDVIPSIDPVSVEGNEYTFNVGDLPPFSGGTIGFIFTISCDAELGQSHCIDATITPDDACHNNEDWNGALVEISTAECLGDSLVFSVTNIGENQMSVPLNYVIVEDGIMLSDQPQINGQLTPGEIFTISLAANGATYAVITNQEPNAPGTDQPTAVFEGCNGNGESFSIGFANILPLASGNPAQSNVCRENVGSYDPNDKMGYPLGWNDGNIEDGTRLDYEIRFQNTGTDTAFTVVISDTIAPELDLATLKMEVASHDYTMTIDTHRVITWTFDNILLPDSSTNLLLSQGSVVFSIDHDDSLIPGNVIENEAAIYFDFNEPIITNVSRHVIAKEGLPVSLRSVAAQSVNLSVYPNPATGLIKVSIPDNDVRPTDVLQVTDLHGQPLLSTRYDQVGRGLNISSLPAGYYLLLVNDAGGFTRGRTAFVVSGK